MLLVRRGWLEEDYPVVLYIHKCYKEVKELSLYTLMQRRAVHDELRFNNT